MRKILFAAVAVVGLCGSANAATIANFGNDPTSAGGAFQHSLGALVGAFSDQYLFHLTQNATLTIASVTNVFAQPSDFITNFSASVIAGTPAIPGATVIGPVAAILGCGPIPNCQGMAGAAFLAAGDYFLDISGIAGGTSGYGGNLAVVAPEVVPLPGAIWLMLSGLAGLFGYQRWRTKKEAAAALAPA